ncbi:MAG: hypothetical protein QNK22_08845 [Xanthomonadales bacterium]|nr:hypothetical protein [Xanthomonadales bacterium]
MKSIAIWLLLSVCCIFLLSEAEAKRKSEPEPPQNNQKAIQEGVMSLADSWLCVVRRLHHA